MRTDDDMSAPNSPEEASIAQHQVRRFTLLLLFLLIAVYAVIGYAIFKVIDALA